jgi:hypothetical protein
MFNSFTDVMLKNKYNYSGSKFQVHGWKAVIKGYRVSVLNMQF